MTRRIYVAMFAIALALGITLFTPWLMGVDRGSEKASSIAAPYPLTFPQDFAWGVAVAAQHVEHQQPSDWTAFERRVISEGKTGTGNKPGEAKPGHIRDLDKVSEEVRLKNCLLYTSPSPRDQRGSRMPSSA